MQTQEKIRTARCGEGIIPLKSVEMLVRASRFIAHYDLLQCFENGEGVPIEAVYSFPLPESCAVSGFEVDINGRKITGRIIKREEAKEEYDNALQRGDGTFMVEQDRPNVFTAHIGNLLPGEKAVVKLSYACELEQFDDLVRLTIPSTISPRYVNDETAINESAEKLQHINPPTAISVPYSLKLRVEAEYASEVIEVSCQSHPASVKIDGRKSIVELNGNIQLDQDIVLGYKLANPHETTALVAADGEDKIVAVNIFPDLKNLQREPCEFIFLVDCSGSMQGESLQVAKAATRACLDLLKSKDKFNIVRFGSDTEQCFAKSVVLNERNKIQAVAWVADLEASGGTEMFAPIKRALEESDSGLPRIVAILSDGQIGNESQCALYLSGYGENCHVFTFGIGAGPNNFALESIARCGRGRYASTAHGAVSAAAKQLASVASSFLKNVRVDFGGLEADLIAPKFIPAIFDGDKITLYARVTGGSASEITVLADTPEGVVKFSAKIDMGKLVDDRALPVLMARKAIREIEEDRWFSESSDDHKGPRKHYEKNNSAVLDLSLRYQIMSSQASFIAIEKREDDSQDMAAERRVTLQALTRGWNGATGPTGGLGVCGISGQRGFSSAFGYSGIPNAYPLAINTPLDRAYLRPLQGCLFDTEFVLGGKNLQLQKWDEHLRACVSFFRRPILQTTAYGGLIKEEIETNINQSSMLDYPREFSATGFGFRIDASATPEEIDEIVKNGIFVFNHKCLEIFRKPLCEFPGHCGAPLGISFGVSTIECPESAAVTPDRAQRSFGDIWDEGYYPHSGFQIKPGDAFEAKVEWKAPPKISRPIRITCLVGGVEWSPECNHAETLDPSKLVGRRTLTDHDVVCGCRTDFFKGTEIASGMRFNIDCVDIVLDPKLSKEDIALLRNNGYICVYSSGRRPFLTMPLSLSNNGVFGLRNAQGDGGVIIEAGEHFCASIKTRSGIKLPPFSAVVNLNGRYYKR